MDISLAVYMDISLAYIVQPVSLYLTSEKDLDQLLKNGWERVRVMAVCFIDGGNRSVRRKLSKVTNKTTKITKVVKTIKELIFFS